MLAAGFPLPAAPGGSLACQSGAVIVLAATPIGNLGDASRRLLEVLEAAPIVAAEDTRTAAHLLRALGVENRPKLVALHEHNERAASADLVEAARDADLVVLTDAGMPGISDPGYVLVEAAIAAGVDVTAIPGPSAVLTALVMSGLPTDRFAFDGFVPRKGRVAWARGLSGEQRTVVVFEAPHRIGASLADLAVGFGSERRAAVCRELTKKFEEVARGTLGELAERFADGARGELVVVIEGAPALAADLPSAVAEVLARASAGERLKAAAADVGAATGLGTRELYEAALAARRG
jgi:16S rRNA (cytidine1402-2'-O)-methyltransferase